MKNPTPFDTIAAVSTPPGEGGIGIVRLSGEKAFDIVGKLFRPRRKTSGGGPVSSFSMRLGHIIFNGKIIDEVLVSFMKKPHTYTREDVVEINCHGGAVAVSEVLRCALAEGARLAEPGEFTKRAFINGRIDLAQAEAVLDVVRAKTSKALESAVAQLKGELSEKLDEISGILKEVLVVLEANIDFSEEEDIQPLDQKELAAKILKAKDELDKLISSYDRGKIYHDGVLTVLCGKPNVGKSSVLNAFLKFDRAIVTPIPGTTRDVIEEQLNIGGIPFILADTAGITEAKNVIEKEGIRRARDYIEKAGLILLVLDGSEPFNERDLEIAHSVNRRPCIPIINKIDLPLRADWDKFRREAHLGEEHVLLSAAYGTGLPELERRMTELVNRGEACGDHSLLLTKARHFNALANASKELGFALKLAGGSSDEPELLAYDVRSALDFIGEITGHITNEAILEEIFESFCVGK